MAGKLGSLVQTGQVLEMVAGAATLYQMGIQGWDVAIAYEDGCWEWVITVRVPAQGDRSAATIEHRHANPETVWARVVKELRERELWTS